MINVTIQAAWLDAVIAALLAFVIATLVISYRSHREDEKEAGSKPEHPRRAA